MCMQFIEQNSALLLILISFFCVDTLQIAPCSCDSVVSFNVEPEDGRAPAQRQYGTNSKHIQIWKTSTHIPKAERFLLFRPKKNGKQSFCIFSSLIFGNFLLFLPFVLPTIQNNLQFPIIRITRFLDVCIMQQ